MGITYYDVIIEIIRLKKEQENKLINSEASMLRYYGARIGILNELLERLERIY